MSDRRKKRKKRGKKGGGLSSSPPPSGGVMQGMLKGFRRTVGVEDKSGKKPSSNLERFVTILLIIAALAVFVWTQTR